ncbi:hypothetical protein [Palaeococcus ferrophilus]|uniref:hypothetical protein n=1 Tax=Palaeococcus ferrophilus TaxID=83868 RepID=UPI00064EF58A|nr:hypothetical protein [Palaeococcus ferrophilus]
MSEEVVQNQVGEDLLEKDITSLVEDVDRVLEAGPEEAESEELEEVVESGGLMTEEEFNARIDEFQEKDHSLTIFANFYVKNLERKAREQGLDVDFSLWWDVGRPSFNAGLWYMEKVEGQSLQVSGKFGLLVGAGSLLLLTWMYRSALKRKGKEKVEKGPAAGGDNGTGESEKPVKTETEALREKAKPKEPEPPKSELLAKINKNLGS